MGSKILLLNRAKNLGVSIQKVFSILTPHFAKVLPVVPVYMNKSGAGPVDVISNILYARKSCRRASVNHITGAVHYLSYGLPKNKTITTVHDLGMLDPSRSHNILRKLYLKLLCLYPLKHNRYIVCISEQTKKEVLSYLKIPDSKIVVIPDPISDDYVYTEHEFNAECPRILCIGTKENKNLHRTIEALSGMNVHLHIIGRLSSQDKALLDKFGVDFSNNFDLSESDLIQEYNKSDIVCFASTYEGFGMPIIEAQMIGRVCVTSDIEPMRTIAGNGAKLVNPYSIQDIRAGLQSVINNAEERNRIIADGRINAQKYTAERVAESYMQLYKEIMDK